MENAMVPREPKNKWDHGMGATRIHLSQIAIIPCVHSSVFIARHDIGQPNLCLHNIKIIEVGWVILRRSAYFEGQAIWYWSPCPFSLWWPDHIAGSISAVSWPTRTLALSRVFLPCNVYLVRRNLSLRWCFPVRMLNGETRHKWNIEMWTCKGKEKGLVQITWLKSFQPLLSWFNPSWQQRTAQALTHSYSSGMWERIINAWVKTAQQFKQKPHTSRSKQGIN